jgi:murein DD-endopeptidase MepM/ murein hydrolase activator NlpD
MVFVPQRREKKQRSTNEGPSTATLSSTNQNAEVKELTQKIHRLDRVKRNIHNSARIVLCAVIISRCYSLFTKVSRRRWGGPTIGGSTIAFQSNMNNQRIDEEKQQLIPIELLQPFGAYPNIFNISEETRSRFHPVIKFPLRASAGIDDSACISGRKLNEIYDYIIKDHTGKVDDLVIIEGNKLPQLLATREEAIEHAKSFPDPTKGYDVGRYDEDRQGMYTSSLFDDSSGSNNQDMRRTVHVGIDIGAPVGTKVHAFEDGIVHSVGYNAAVGDYGHVIVIEHVIPSPANGADGAKLYALYGHLAKSVLDNKVGDRISKGQVIGHIGNTDENGGWTGTHLHFQVAVNPPEMEHDMPGTVRLVDRNIALLEYVDPRYVLGELY